MGRVGEAVIVEKRSKRWKGKESFDNQKGHVKPRKEGEKEDRDDVVDAIDVSVDVWI